MLSFCLETRRNETLGTKGKEQFPRLSRSRVCLHGDNECNCLVLLYFTHEWSWPQNCKFIYSDFYSFKGVQFIKRRIQSKEMSHGRIRKDDYWRFYATSRCLYFSTFSQRLLQIVSCNITFKITSCKFNINTESVGKLVLVTLEFYVQLNVCPEELTEVYSETKRSKTWLCSR